MSSKSKKRKPEVSLTKAVTIAECIFLWAWVSVYHPTQEDCDRMEKELRNVRESVATHRLNVWDIKQALKDEYDIEMCSVFSRTAEGGLKDARNTVPG